MHKFREYIEREGVSQSFLKRLDDDPQLASVKEDTKSMLKGSIVDVMVTGDFDKTYKIHKADVPKGQLLWFADSMVYLHDKEGVEDKYEQSYQWVKKKNPGPVRDDVAKFIKRFEEEAKDYYVEHTSDEFTYITQEEYDEAEKHYTLLNLESKLQFYLQNRSGVEHTLYQEPIFFNLKGVPCKALLDIIVVDHAEGEVHPVDLKTTYNVNQFVYSMRKYRYDFQGAWYFTAVSMLAKQRFPDYEIMPFHFIVSDGLRKPLLYKLSDTDLIIGTKGGVDRYGGRVKGYEELLDDYLYYQEHGNLYPREYAEKGYLETDAFMV